MINAVQSNPEMLREALAIAVQGSPLVPERAHLVALVAESRKWTSTLMEAPTKTLRCQHPGCKNGFVLWFDEYTDETRRTECPVCEGHPDITFETVAEYAMQITDLRKENMELRRAAARKSAQYGATQ